MILWHFIVFPIVLRHINPLDKLLSSHIERSVQGVGSNDRQIAGVFVEDTST